MFFSEGCKKNWGGRNLLIHRVGVQNKNETSHYPTHTFLNYQKSQAKKPSVSLHILHTVFYTFLKVPMRKLYLNIDTVSLAKNRFLYPHDLERHQQNPDWINPCKSLNDKMLWVGVEGLTWSNFFDALIITFRYHSQTLAVTIFCVKVSCQSDREKTCQLPTENNASFKHSSCISHIKVTFETWLVLCQITVRNDCLGEALWPSFLWNILVTGKISDSFPKTVQFDSIQFNNPLVRLNPVPGGSTHILMTGGEGGGSEGFFWVWHFGQKGFFWVYERRRYFFESQKQHRDFFEYCIFHQLKSTMT